MRRAPAVGTARPRWRRRGRATGTGTAGSTVRVEVLFLRRGPEPGTLAYRRRYGVVADGTTPEEVARELCGTSPGLSVLHSTSWRQSVDRGVVLTYAVVPDPDPSARATPLDDASVVSSGDPLQPQPARLLPEHVAAHAVRHLAELAGRDPAVARAARSSEQQLWALITEVGAAVPTTPRHGCPHDDPGAADLAGAVGRARTSRS